MKHRKGRSLQDRTAETITAENYNPLDFENINHLRCGIAKPALEIFAGFDLHSEKMFEIKFFTKYQK